MLSDAVKTGPQRGPHRSLLKAAGLNDSDIRRPFIAVVNSHTDVVPGHVHLDAVGRFVKRRVELAGGTAMIFNTIAICDGIAMGHSGMKYSLASRELIADSVESMCRAHRFDAMICIPNCDKVTPGMLMAAARLNIPTVFCSGGPMEAGRVDGREVDLIDQFYAVARLKTGEMTRSRAKCYEDNTCPTCGSCSGMFTANSMNCLCEAIGLALPGNGTCLATSFERVRLFARAAKLIVAMAKAWADMGCRGDWPFLPRSILTKHAFENAMTLDMAMGGSSNTVLHLLALADEAGVPFSLDDIARISRRTPNICRITPSTTPEGRNYHMQDCHRAGGIHTILHQLMTDRPALLREKCRTVAGDTLDAAVKQWSLRSRHIRGEAKAMYAEGWKATRPTVEDVRRMYLKAAESAVIEPPARPKTIYNADPDFDGRDVIRTVRRAFTSQGALRVLYGNIAEKGAVVKVSGLDERMYRFIGPARICESQEDACKVILSGKVHPGDVVVIRNEGPRGGPGMQEMLAPTSYIRGLGLYDKCYLITDGRFSGGTSGPSVGHISPEASAGGAIGLLKDGDIIEIDIPAGGLNARLSGAELARRRKRYTPPPPRITHGSLGRYASQVSSADTGAVLQWPGKTRPRRGDYD